MTLDELWALVERGEVDTVVLAMTDMQGRLQGKRLDAETFVADIAAHGAEACNYLLAVDVDVSTLLPGDDASYGFDNITVAELTPTLLERYLAVAQKISRLARIDATC